MLYKNVKKAAEKQGVTFYRIEKDSGIGNGTIAKWKTATPSLSTLSKVADYLGVSVTDLLEDVQQKQEV